MSKSDNLQDLLTDVANAIRERKQTTELINPQDFSKEIKTINYHGYTGHADADGLKAIGWTDEDISYYQTYGVDWNEEDDNKHLVSDDNKALYGVLTASNISEYKERIIYLPKIDTSGIKNMSSKFEACHNMIALPFIDTSSATNVGRLFYMCYSLRTIPPLDTSNATYMLSFLSDCHALIYCPHIDTRKSTNSSYLLYLCYSLTEVPNIDLSEGCRITAIFYNTYSLRSVKFDARNIDTSGERNYFHFNYTLHDVEISHLRFGLNLQWSRLLTKESILYLINNEAATDVITITLHSYVYNKYAEDSDVVEALSNHPNVLLASA